MNTLKLITNSAGEQEYVEADFRGELKLNADGYVSTEDLGYRYAITTLTYIFQQVVKQKFYEIPWATFQPVLVGQGGWNDFLVTNKEISAADDAETGLANTGDGYKRIPSVQAGLSPQTIGVNHWNKRIEWNIAQINQALAARNWDNIAALVYAIKKNWDLGIQAWSFLGLKSDTTQTGLLNSADVNVDTTVITEPISAMSDTEYQAFIGALLNSYFENSNNTVLPDRFVIPTSDYLGLGAATSTTFPLITKLQYLQDTLSRMTDGRALLMHTAYNQAARNADWGVNKDIYMLYRNDPMSLNMHIPIDFNLLAPGTPDGYSFSSTAYARFTTTQFLRPLESLRFEFTPAS